MSDTNISWRAPSHRAYQRSKQWYMGAGITVVVLVAYAIVTSAWSFAIVIALAAAVYFLLRNHPSHEYVVIISEMGISIDGVFSAWDTWKRFWMLTAADGHWELHMSPVKKNRRDFVVIIDGADPIQVRDTLKQHLVEDTQQQEKLFDMILRICKL